MSLFKITPTQSHEYKPLLEPVGVKWTVLPQIHRLLRQRPTGRITTMNLDALHQNFPHLFQEANVAVAHQHFRTNELIRFTKKNDTETSRKDLTLEKSTTTCRNLRLEARDMTAKRPEFQNKEYYFNPVSELPEPRSQAWKEILSEAKQAAWSKAPILLTGESGTGKEVVARFIHEHSPRADGPFVPLNCGALPEALLESELFGYCKGAFTGAIADKKGLAVQADSGTLFLDEIGEASPGAQVKLLRFLQDFIIVPVGGLKPIKVDVRVISATNLKLEEAIHRGVFRSDLFFRVNVFQFELPPLRNRIEDIPGLTEFFIDKFNEHNSTAVQGLAPAAMTVLTSYSWPGNVRELENVIHRAVVLAGNGYIEAVHLPAHMLTGPNRSVNGDHIKARAWLETLLDALEKALALPPDRLGRPRRLGTSLPLEHLADFFEKFGHQPFKPKDFAAFIAPPNKPRRDKMAFILLKTLHHAGIIVRNDRTAQAVRYVLAPSFRRDTYESETEESKVA
ncbi:MAG: sigma-54-dependent Fis family transcriptional regulator [Deltaproteobacteria bacterium]|nr:sigma-54-dependent Fis family transcriptional regulator [Deltaproteobacteria bacterium]